MQAPLRLFGRLRRRVPAPVRRVGKKLGGARLLDMLMATDPAVVPRAERHDARYYDDIKDEEHIFVFGVCGRASTTALQRLLNSTNQVCVWGEPGDYLVDKLITSAMQMRRKMNDGLAAGRVAPLRRAFLTRDHSINYAMAHSNWSPLEASLIESFSSMWRPPVPEIRRFGFKEIQVQSGDTLTALRAFYPRSHIVYIFRDPRKQWPSVQKMDWRYSFDLDRFLEEYAHMARTYLAAGGLFVHNGSLLSRERVRTLTAALHLPNVDESLIADGVYSLEDKPALEPEEERAIVRSAAFRLYEQLLELDRAVFDKSASHRTRTETQPA